MESRVKRLKTFQTKGETPNRIEDDINHWLLKNPQNIIFDRNITFIRNDHTDQLEVYAAIWYEVGPKPSPEVKVKPDKGMEPSVIPQSSEPGAVFEIPNMDAAPASEDPGEEELDEPETPEPTSDEVADQELQEPGHEESGPKRPAVPSETEEKEFIANRNKPVNVRK